MQEVNVKVETTNGELVIRHGDAYPVREPNQVFIEANILAPAEYLVKMIESLNPKNCFVEASVTKKQIKFTIGHHDVYRDTIAGKLVDSTILRRLPINTEKTYTPKELGQLLKKNKFLFANDADFTNLVGKLLAFSASIQTKLEKVTEQKGNSKNLLEHNVTGDLPEYFLIDSPIFEGMPNKTFRVEIFAEVTSSSVMLSLESSELIDLEYKYAKELVEEQLKPFEEFGCPIFYS